MTDQKSETDAQQGKGHRNWLTALGCFPLLVLCFATAAAGSGEAPGEVSPHLYVFVSSSLPMGRLIAIAKDAALLDAPVILRGLVGNSLQETLLNLKDVVAEGVALEVDPLPFEAYGITAVPAVVLTCGNRNEGPFALLYGLDGSRALPYLRKALPRC